MYDLETGDFFCCPNGYFGVLPLSGASGVCEVEGVDVPVSQLASMASQIGGTAPATINPTLTLEDGTTTTITNGEFGTTATTGGIGGTLTGGTSAGGTGGPAQTSSGDSSSSSSSTSFPIGASVGIAIGGVVILVVAIALVLWMHRRSMRKHVPQQIVYHAPTAPSEPPMQQEFKTQGEMQVQPTGSTLPSYPYPSPSPNPPFAVAEIPGTPRAEMEATGPPRQY